MSTIDERNARIAAKGPFSDEAIDGWLLRDGSTYNWPFLVEWERMTPEQRRRLAERFLVEAERRAYKQRPTMATEWARDLLKDEWIYWKIEMAKPLVTADDSRQ